MDIIQSLFVTGELVRECTWDIVVLLPKSRGKYHEMCLVEDIWKVIAIIIAWRLADYIKLHEILHRSIAWIGTGKANLEVKSSRRLRACFRRSCMRYLWISIRIITRWTGGAPWRSWKGTGWIPRYNDS